MFGIFGFSMYSEFIQKLNKILGGIKSCVIIPHKNPDADALGASLALSIFLTKKKINANVILPNSPPSYLKWMLSGHEVISYEESPEESKRYLSRAEIIFALDFNSLKRIGLLSHEIEKNKTQIVMIDHHELPENFSTVFLSEPKIGSTCEIVYNIMKSINKKFIDKEIATYIYSGILTDTGSFKYPLTSGVTHKIVSELFKKGINHTDIHERIYDNFSFDRICLLATALKNLKYIDKLGVAYMVLTNKTLKKYNFKRGDTEGFVNFGLRINGVSLSVIFIEDKNENLIKISFRSKNNLDVNRFAKKYFSGGGHKNAAGGFSKDSINETEKKFISSIHEFLK